ncbi:c2H2-type domain-containing protein [Caerostris extrusa]|uniref:C2H2-type domain-containing protein n=1 Tax=Caerostris extrusa TaxID=172846 RepID=A0AAV4XLQ5_CAEEX|nr:c2H2-type domain-containing protein [Caerostris extrusa]
MNSGSIAESNMDVNEDNALAVPDSEINKSHDEKLYQNKLEGDADDEQPCAKRIKVSTSRINEPEGLACEIATENAVNAWVQCLKVISDKKAVKNFAIKRNSKGKRKRSYAGSKASTESFPIDKFPQRSGITWKVGAPIQAYEKNLWYEARIIDINCVKCLVKIHYLKWNSRYDLWLPMESDLIRSIENQISEPNVTKELYQQFNVGQNVLAKWKDNNFYEAVVKKCLGNDEYLVYFAPDGIQRKKHASDLKEYDISEVERINDPIKIATKQFVHYHGYELKVKEPKDQTLPTSEKPLEIQEDKLGKQNFINQITTKINEAEIETNSLIQCCFKENVSSEDLCKNKSSNLNNSSYIGKQESESEFSSLSVESSKEIQDEDESLLPKRSSSRKVSLPAKFANSEIFLISPVLKQLHHSTAAQNNALAQDEVCDTKRVSKKNKILPENLHDKKIIKENITSKSTKLICTKPFRRNETQMDILREHQKIKIVYWLLLKILLNHISELCSLIKMKTHFRKQYLQIKEEVGY